MNLTDRLFGPVTHEPEDGDVGEDEEQWDEEQWLAHHDGTCDCHASFWMRGIVEQSTTLVEVIERVEGFVAWLKGLEVQGFELEQPVDNGHGYLLRGPVVH